VRALAGRIERLQDIVDARRRISALAIVVDLPAAPSWATPIGRTRYARVIGGDKADRRRIVGMLSKGRVVPAGVVVLEYFRGVSQLIALALSTPEAAGFGARGDGKTGAIPAIMALHADLHRETGHPLPVRWLGIADTYTSHAQKTVPSWEQAWLGGLVTFREDQHIAVVTVDGVELAHMRLLGIEDQGAADRVRTECTGIWGEEAAPALVMESSGGVSESAWGIARTSQRLPSVHKPAVLTLNYPDMDHWTWQRFVVRKHPGTDYVRIPPGERASDSDRQAWADALEGRPDLLRRLLAGEPGVIAEGPAVAVGYASERHVSPKRLQASQNATLLIGIDGGLTPSATIAQYLGGGAWFNVLAVLACERGGTRQLCEDYIRPWLASRASWWQQARALVLHIDPSLDVPDQSNLEASPTRVMRAVLGGAVHLGPVDWPSRRDPLLALLGKNNPHTGRPILQIDPEDAMLLDRALAGRWHYPLVRGQVSREAPVKNHPWSDIADSATYVIAGVAPSRAERKPNGWKPPAARGLALTHGGRFSASLFGGKR